MRECVHLYVNCSIIYSSQDLEAAQMSINRIVHKATMVHLHNGTLLGHKKEKNLPFETAWMDLRILC